jgi:DNA-directed RNA polymerase specialized sigma24 family protein
MPQGLTKRKTEHGLGRARAGQQEAWQRLVDLYGPVVYRWCRGWGLGQEDAADVVQEVFVAVSSHIKEFHRDRPEDTFGGWLRTIAHNKVRDSPVLMGPASRAGLYCPRAGLS